MPSVQLNSTCFLLEKREKKSRWPTTLSDAVEAELRASTQVENRLSIFQGTTYKTSTMGATTACLVCIATEAKAST